jgi:GAF domain-containing protein/HAMP domain-containing protein
MSVSRSQSTAEKIDRERNAFWTSVIVLAVSGVYAIYLTGQAVQIGTAERLRAAVMMAALAVVSLISAWLCRRGRSTTGMLMLFGWFFAVILESTTRQAGQGILLGAIAVLVTILTAFQTLPRRWAIRISVASIVVGISAALLDIFLPTARPNFGLGAPLVAVTVLIIAVGILMARRFKSYSLRTKLVVSFLLVSVLSVVIVAGFAIALSQDALTKSANRSLETAASKTAAAIDSFLTAEKDTLRTEALLPDLAELLSLPVYKQAGTPQADKVEAILHSLVLREPLYIKSYALLDASGWTIYSTSHENLGEYQFHKVVETGLPYVSDIEFPPDSNEPSLYIAAPVRNANREVVGVLRVRYDATILQELVRGTNGLAGAESFATLLDDQNIRLGSGQDTESLYKTIVPVDAAQMADLQLSRRLPERPVEELATNYPEFEAGLNSSEPYFAAEILGPRTQPGVPGRTEKHIEQVALAPLENKAWRIAFAQPQNVFLQPIQAQTGVITIISLLVAGLAALGALALSQTISSPIVHLTAVANQVKEGDLTAQAPVETGDEIGDLALSFNSMTAQLRGIVSTLEERIQARTEQLRASADVGRTAASVLNPDDLLRSVVNLITERFGFYYAAVFTSDSQGRYAILREATGEAGQVLKAQGHQLEIGGQSMVGQAMAHRRLRIALDVGVEAVRFANPLLPSTRSEIALPLVVGDQVLGALDVQSTEEAAFDESNAAVLQSMADQIAIALSNALSYTETQSVARRSRALFAASREVGRVQADVADTIRAMMQTAADTLTYDHWCVLTFNEFRTALVTIAAHNWPDPTESLDVQEQADHPLVRSALRNETLQINDPQDGRWHELAAAHLHNLLSVPIVARDTFIGVVGVSRAIGELTDGDLEVGRSLAALAAIAIENYHLRESSQRTLHELDEANRQLTGAGWEKYARRRGQQDLIWVSRSDQLQPQPLPEVTEAVTLGHVATRLLSDGREAQLGVAVPIKLRDVPIGTLRMIVPLRAWTTEMANSLESIASHVAQAAENARLIAESEERLARERALTEATEKVRQRNDIDSILETAATELARYLNANRIAIRLNPPTDQADGNGQTG